MKTLAVVAALLGLGTFAVAQEKKRELKDRVELEGTIVCVGCELTKESGADSQCTLHAKHAQGLLLKDGTLWTILDNGRGHVVRTNDKLRGKEVKVHGWKYPKAQTIELWRYSIKDGDKWTQFDYCKTCGFEKGDHKDKDLCEDCQK